MRKATYRAPLTDGLRRIEFGCIGVIDKMSSDRRMLTDNFWVRFPLPLMARIEEMSRCVGFVCEVECVPVGAIFRDGVMAEGPKVIVRAEGWIEDEFQDRKLWPAIDADHALTETSWLRDSDVFRTVMTEWTLVGVTLHEKDPGVWEEVVPGVIY